MEHVLKNTYTIASDDADFRSKLHVSSLVNFFIQSAWQHAEAFGVGFSHLSGMGMFWVLSRFTIEMDNLPTWPGEITLSTWSKGLHRLFYMRDADFLDESGESFARLTSAWIMVDKNSKRPKVYNPEWLSQYHHAGKHAIEEPVPALKTDGQPTLSQSYTIRYTDIDMNQHLTTIRYIDFIFDTYTPAFIKKNTPKKLIVNFLKEIPIGEEVVMHRYEQGNEHDFELVTTSGSSRCFRARIIY